MRRHGWELPFHPLQVVAIAVFVSLAFAFYVFFAPFIGTHLMQLISISCYSPLVVSVFGLYIWCAATNPADPAVLHSKKYLGNSSAASLRTSPSLFSWGRNANESSTEPSILTQPSSVQSIIEAEDLACEQNQFIVCLGGLSICLHNPKPPCNEDRLYCSLCEVEILKHSKHCRVCDKCVDRFDHHCRWINNCIGRKNYRIFIALMATGICMLVLQWSAGVWVIARCFLNRVQFEEDIMNKLGGSFTVVPFLIVVAVCTVISAFITLPLCQLCLFHALLIHKGISTYDYIVAMREQDQPFGPDESRGMQSPFDTSSTSPEEATGASAISSMGALHRPHHSPSSWHTNIYEKDDAANMNYSGKEKQAAAAEVDGLVRKQQQQQQPAAAAKISPWALARLNPEDARRASAEARRKSSVLRPLTKTTTPHDDKGFVIPETDISGEYSSGGDLMMKDLVAPMMMRMRMPPPLSMERESVRLDNLLLSSKMKTTNYNNCATSTRGSHHHGHGQQEQGSSAAGMDSNYRPAVNVPPAEAARPSSTDEAKKLLLFSDGSSSCSTNGSRRSSSAANNKVAVCLTPLQLEARNAFCREDSGSGSISTTTMTPNDGSPDIRISCESSTESNISTTEEPAAVELLQQRNNVNLNDDEDVDYATTDHSSSTVPRPTIPNPPPLTFLRSTSCDGYEASGGDESADDFTDMHLHYRRPPPPLPHSSSSSASRFRSWNDQKSPQVRHPLDRVIHLPDAIHRGRPLLQHHHDPQAS